MAESRNAIAELMNVSMAMNTRMNRINLDWNKMKELKREEKEELVERLSDSASSISALMRSIADSEFLSKESEIEDDQDDVRILNGTIIDISVHETARRFENLGQRCLKRFKEEDAKNRKSSNGLDHHQDTMFTERMASVFHKDLTELSESKNFTDMDASILTDLLACGAISFQDLESSPVSNEF